MNYQLFRLMACMDSVFACDDQLPADRDHWHELKRHIVALSLVHTTLREERERGIPLTAETARKLEGYAQRPWAFEGGNDPPLNNPAADLEKSSCKSVGSPLRGVPCWWRRNWGEHR